MKKRIRLLGILFCLLVAMTVVFTACNRVEPVGDLSARQVRFVRKSYYNSFENKKEVDMDDIKIVYHLGTYNENIVVILHYLPKGVDIGEVTVSVYVSDVFITELGTSAYKIIVCTPQGRVYDLQSAYDAKLILYEDLPLISEIAEGRWGK